MRIWKYHLKYTGDKVIRLHVPRKAKYLSLLPITQDGNPTVYFEVDPEEPTDQIVDFVVLATGEQKPDCGCGTFLGTVVDPQLGLV